MKAGGVKKKNRDCGTKRKTQNNQLLEKGKGGGKLGHESKNRTVTKKCGNPNRRGENCEGGRCKLNRNYDGEARKSAWGNQRN